MGFFSRNVAIVLYFIWLWFFFLGKLCELVPNCEALNCLHGGKCIVDPKYKFRCEYVFHTASHKSAHIIRWYHLYYLSCIFIYTCMFYTYISYMMCFIFIYVFYTYMYFFCTLRMMWLFYMYIMYDVVVFIFRSCPPNRAGSRCETEELCHNYCQNGGTCLPPLADVGLPSCLYVSCRTKMKTPH